MTRSAVIEDRNMKCRWLRRPFSSAAFEIIDGDRGKEYPQHDDFQDNGYCLFLNTGNVRPDGFDFSNCQFITEEKDQRLRKGKLMRHDLVMTTRGTIGNVAYYDDSIPYENIRINSGMVWRNEPNNGIVFWKGSLIRGIN